MKEIRTGWAQADITPSVPVGLLGQYEQRTAYEIGSPLKAVVLAAAQEGQRPVYWAACDLLYTPARLLEDTAALLEGTLPDFEPSQLILSATHTHTAPYCVREAESALVRFTNPDPALLQPEEYRAFAAARIADAVREARSRLEPSTLSTAVSPIQTGYCRRVVYRDGSAVMYGGVSRPDFACMEYHDGGCVNLLYTHGADGRLTGVVANVPCTAQVVEHKSYVSADYWGYTRAYVAERLGVPVLGVTASAGDLSPRDLLTALPEEPSMNDEEGARYLGERVAREIVRHHAAAQPLDASEYRHLAKTVWLPRWNPTFAEYRAAQEAGLLERVLEVGWAGLTAKESGRIGGLLAHKNRE